MDQSQLRALEEQCIQESPPPCTAACPLHVDGRALCEALAKADFSAGLKILRKASPFPGILAHVCDEPCREKCNRTAAGGALRLRDLERACVAYGEESAGRTNPIPKKAGRVAVIGGGLSGLSAAGELIRKGYRVSLFEAGPRLGGRLWEFGEASLPAAVITAETERILRLDVDLHLGEKVLLLEGIPPAAFCADWDAVYLGCGPAGAALCDPLTLQTAQPGLFAGGGLLHAPSVSLSISDGRRAAISIDRYLQKVSLSAGRVNEGPYESRLYTNLHGLEPAVERFPRDVRQGYTREEAAAEADRCILCECMECVKSCTYLERYGAYPKKYVREIYNNLSIIMRARTSNQFINSCTLCGQCAVVCPTDLDMGKVILEARRTMVKTNKMPASAHDFALRDMAFSNAGRAALVIAPGGAGGCETLFFPGCQLTAADADSVPRVYRDLLATEPGMGLMLRCCGAPAAWAGEDALFEQAAEGLRADWEKLGRPRLVLACSSCKQMLARILPEAQSRPLWEVLLERGLYASGCDFSGWDCVVHDPCTSRHEADWQDSARALLEALGVPFHELAASRERTECCGYGGLAWLANPELAGELIRRRVGEDEGTFLTYCAMCRDLCAGAGKPALHLLDLIYGENLPERAKRPAADYSQRHENRLRTKQNVIKMVTGKDYRMAESYEGIRVEIPPEVRARMEERLILVEDVQKVIEHAEKSGERFLNRTNGHFLAGYKPHLITYWVEYTTNGIQYRVMDAYSHRMELEEDSSL